MSLNRPNRLRSLKGGLAVQQAETGGKFRQGQRKNRLTTWVFSDQIGIFKGFDSPYLVMASSFSSMLAPPPASSGRPRSHTPDLYELSHDHLPRLLAALGEPTTAFAKFGLLLRDTVIEYARNVDTVYEDVLIFNDDLAPSNGTRVPTAAAVKARRKRPSSAIRNNDTFERLDSPLGRHLNLNLGARRSLAQVTCHSLPPRQLDFDTPTPVVIHLYHAREKQSKLGCKAQYRLNQEEVLRGLSDMDEERMESEEIEDEELRLDESEEENNGEVQEDDEKDEDGEEDDDESPEEPSSLLSKEPSSQLSEHQEPSSQISGPEDEEEDVDMEEQSDIDMEAEDDSDLNEILALLETRYDPTPLRICYIPLLAICYVQPLAITYKPETPMKENAARPETDEDNLEREDENAGPRSPKNTPRKSDRNSSRKTSPRKRKRPQSESSSVAGSPRKKPKIPSFDPEPEASTSRGGSGDAAGSWWRSKDTFDVEVYKRKVQMWFPREQDVVDFGEIVAGKPRREISRLFVTTLFMVNNGEVLVKRIRKNRIYLMDTFKLKLLSP